MGWFASSKKKAANHLEGCPTSDRVYQPQPVPPCASGPFHHGPHHPAPRQLEHPSPPLLGSSSNDGHTPSPSHIGHYYYPQSTTVVNHYYVAAPGPPSFSPHARGQGDQGDQGDPGSGIAAAVSKLHLGSVVNLATDLVPMNLPHFFDNGPPPYLVPRPTLVGQGAVLYNQLSSVFDRVLTSIDNGQLDSLEADLSSILPSAGSQAAPASTPVLAVESRHERKHASGKNQPSSLLSSIKSGNYFAKVDLYANSKLPYDLPPVQLYIASYRLLSLAARFSDRAYQQPQARAESRTHIDADWRAGTKAMVIQSVPMDDVNTIVFAIRGTANFMDWAVNLNIAPISPAGFLDDPGNLCHSGFLSTARRMVRPVALRLRQLLEEDPGRSSYSLLITGHSAGGAVASLLYSHMLSTSSPAESELNLLTGCFRRVHCITFGAPPVSLLPLKIPEDRHELKKSLFYSFVNEGDPVARADKAYVKSLIDLFASSVPVGGGRGKESRRSPQPPPGSGSAGTLRGDMPECPSKPHMSPRPHRSSKPHCGSRSREKLGRPDREYSPEPVWKVPPSTLSNAGRIIVLRSGNPQAGLLGKKTVEERLAEGVIAQFTSDEQLRDMIWGDPVCHAMKLYAGRVEALAIAAMMVDT